MHAGSNYDMDYRRGHCEHKLNSLVLNESSLAFGQFSSLKKKTLQSFSSLLFPYIRVFFFFQLFTPVFLFKVGPK